MRVRNSVRTKVGTTTGVWRTYGPGRTQGRDAERPKSVWQTGYGPVVRSLMNAPVREMGWAGGAEDGALRGVPDSDTERSEPQQEGRAVCS